MGSLLPIRVVTRVMRPAGYVSWVPVTVKLGISQLMGSEWLRTS